jgi:N-acetylglutamate synthase-like GNAT family acetyltransferase
MGRIRNAWYGRVAAFSGRSVDIQIEGVGVAVLRVIEAKAAEQGIARFHLLTTTASGFFEQQGYAVNQRGSAPPLISQTEQFRGFALARLATCARHYLRMHESS